MTEQWSLTADLPQGLVKYPRDQGCPADLRSRDTTRDAHLGDPSPLPPAALRWSSARDAPLAGGKRTLNLMKLRGVGCSAGPPTAVPAALPATRAPALPWWMLSGPVSRAECWVSTKTTTTTHSCFQFLTPWQSRRERHVTDSPLLNSMGLKIKILSFAQLGRKHQHLR